MPNIFYSYPRLSDSDPISSVGRYSRDLASDLPHILSGTVSMSFDGANSTWTDVLFTDLGYRFNEPPVVQVTQTSSNTAPRFICHVWNITTTGCRIGFYTTDAQTHTGTREAAWVAIGRPWSLA